METTLECTLMDVERLDGRIYCSHFIYNKNRKVIKRILETWLISTDNGTSPVWGKEHEFWILIDRETWEFNDSGNIARNYSIKLYE